MKEFINEALSEYRSENPYPWHMPGHKRKDCYGADRWRQMFAYDFTEAEGLDDMHNPRSFIRNGMDSLRKIYGSYKTYMLVNGATGGILAAIYACCKPGDFILLGRNCHKSVYNAVNLLRLSPVYLVPEIIGETDILGEITPENVRVHLMEMIRQKKQPSAVVLTSPTYEGVVSDIKGISHILRQYSIPLIVDEAHGAHFTFMGEDTPAPAIKNGADFVIESLHKTLPSLTQTAVLHIADDRYQRELERYLQVFQTSSPSYLFMQSIEKAAVFCQSSPERFLQYRKRLMHFRKQCEQLEYLTLFYPAEKVYGYDTGKLVIRTRTDSEIDYQGKRRRMTGVLLARILIEDYRQIPEMAAAEYIIAMTSVMDDEEAFDRLYQALGEIDQRISLAAKAEDSDGPESAETCLHRKRRLSCTLPVMRMLPGEAWDQDCILTELESAEGLVAGEYIYAYPPGIPVVVPGEVISAQIIETVRSMLDEQLNVTGIYLSGNTVKVAVVGG